MNSEVLEKAMKEAVKIFEEAGCKISSKGTYESSHSLMLKISVDAPEQGK